MELDDALAFARERSNGVLTTLKRDARPQLSNITYHLGDDDVATILLSTADVIDLLTNTACDGFLD